MTLLVAPSVSLEIFSRTRVLVVYIRCSFYGGIIDLTSVNFYLVSGFAIAGFYVKKGRDAGIRKLLRKITKLSVRYEGDTPLPLAYCVLPYFGLAYVLRTAIFLPRVLRTV